MFHRIRRREALPIVLFFRKFMPLLYVHIKILIRFNSQCKINAYLFVRR